MVKIAKEQPRRYGRHGELLINYDDTEEHLKITGKEGVKESSSLKVTSTHHELLD